MSETQTSVFKSPIYIHIQDGAETVYEKSFHSGPILIGRSLTSDIPLPQYEWISRKHARIEERKDGCYLIDLGSSNGVKLKDKGYVKEVRITPGLEVKIGGLVINFSLEKSKVPKRPAKGDVDETLELEATEEIHSSQKKKRRTIVSRPIQSETPSRKGVVRSRKSVQSKKSGKSTKKSKASKAKLKNKKDRYKPSVPKKKFDSEETLYGDDQRSSSSQVYEGILGKGDIDGLKSMTPNQPYQGLHRLPKNKRSIEVYVTWKGQVIDSYVCRKGETLYAGRESEHLYIPTVHGSIPLLDFRRSDANVILPTTKGHIVAGRGQTTPLTSVVTKEKNRPCKWSLQVDQALTIDIGNDILIHVRYAPTPRQLSKMPLYEFDLLMKQGIGLSTAAHLLLILLAVFLPKEPPPKIKGIPPRVAKLLVQKPKPKPKPKPKEKKKEPPKIAKKKTPPKKVAKKKPPKKKVVRKRPKRIPKKVVVRSNKKIRKINTKNVAKVSSKVRSKGPVSKTPPKKVENLGALAALGALGAPTANPSNKPVALNINPNAGGAPKNNSTSGLIGTLKSKSGKLAASGGMSSVKTKGKGFGTGTGYGVQGVKGSAGSRGVAGAVIGSPKLMKVKRSEGLTQKQVMAVVKKKAGKIQQCYERALLTSPGIQGRVEYGWYIRPSGKVKWAKVRNSSVRNADSLNNCVIKVFMSMRFPKAKNGASTQPTIGFPFGRM